MHAAKLASVEITVDTATLLAEVQVAASKLNVPLAGLSETATLKVQSLNLTLDTAKLVADMEARTAAFKAGLAAPVFTLSNLIAATPAPKLPEDFKGCCVIREQLYPADPRLDSTKDYPLAYG